MRRGGGREEGSREPEVWDCGAAESRGDGFWVEVALPSSLLEFTEDADEELGWPEAVVVDCGWRARDERRGDTIASNPLWLSFQKEFFG